MNSIIIVNIGECELVSSYRKKSAHSETFSRVKRVLSPICTGKQKGSLTLEAAIAVPFFLLFCIAVMSFIAILFIQMNLQISMEETSRSMGKKAYILQQISSGNVTEDEFSGEEITLASVGINPTTIKIWLLSNSRLRAVLDNSRIIGKSGGLYTFYSSYDEDCGILDIVTHYDYLLPWLPESFGKLRLAQRIRSHVWTGKSLKENGGDDSDESGETVYITPTGTVYHTSKSCSYLDLSIHASDTSQVSSQRNLNGGKYERCSGCTQAGYSGVAYITDYGTNWHSSLSCSGLKRTVTETSIDDVHDMRACSKCGNGK